LQIVTPTTSHPLLEPLHLEHLHLDDEPPPRRVGALDVDDRELEIGYVDVLVAAQVLDVEDLTLALELEQVVEQRDQQRLARLRPKIRLTTKSVLESAKTGAPGTFYGRRGQPAIRGATRPREHAAARLAYLWSPSVLRQR
jgi:hypothetical protein